MNRPWLSLFIKRKCWPFLRWIPWIGPGIWQAADDRVDLWHQRCGRG